MSYEASSIISGFAPERRLSVPGKVHLERAWGSLDFRTAPGGRRDWYSYRLTVLPPGTSRAERHRLALMRGWVAPGAIIAPFVVAMAWVASPVLAGFVLTIYLGPLVLGLHSTRRLRSGTRTLTVNVVPGGWLVSKAMAETFLSSIGELHALEAAAAAGGLDPVHYELGWTAVYTKLAG